MCCLQADEAVAKNPSLFRESEKCYGEKGLSSSLELERKYALLSSGVRDECEMSVAGPRLVAQRSFAMLRYVQ